MNSWIKRTILAMMIMLVALAFTACNKVGFEINFIVDGAVCATVETDGKETIDMPNDPVKEGYTFEGWYLDNGTWEQEFTADSLLDEALSSNIQVYAKFVINHTHNFSKKVLDDDYLKNTATCELPETYFYSCECGAKGEATFTIGEALGHSFISYISDENATTEADGTKTAHCENEGCTATDTITDEGSKLPTIHTHSYSSVVTPPSCTAQGYTTHTCTCGDSYKDSYVAANGHTFVSGVCSVCGEFTVEGSVGIIYELSDDSTYYEVVDIGDCADADIIIASMYNGKPVKAIADSAFDYCDSITSVTIPSGITTIGDDAFYKCDNLVTVSLPSGIISIGRMAFQGCASLTSIVIPNTVISIGEQAFFVCSGLKTVTFEKNSHLASIGNSAFGSCTKLETLIIPESVTSIGESVFYWCPKLTSIAFEGSTCWYVSETEGAASGTGISVDDATQNATYLKNTYLSYYWYRTLGGHNYAAVVTRPSCTEQGYTTYTCANCNHTYVGDFKDAQGHDEVSHSAKSPTCVDYGWNAYVTCSRCDYSTYSQISATGQHNYVNGVCQGCGATQSHTHSYSSTVVNPTCGESGYTLHTCTCGDSYKDTYTNATGQHNYVNGLCQGCGATQSHTHSYSSTVVQPSCTESGYTLHTCDCGESYTDSITAATGHNFVSGICSSCQANIIDYTIDSYDVSANLDGKITAYVVKVGDIHSLYVLGEGEMKNYESSNTPLYVDGYYDKITSVYIGDAVESIGDFFLYMCRKVNDIRLPSSLKSIGKFAVSYCDALTSIDLPNALTNIGNYAFYSNDGITTIKIPSTVTTLGQNSFGSCTKLAEIKIDDNTQLQIIGDDAFNSTAYYNNSSNWNGKVLYIGCCLIKAKTTISGEFTVGSNIKVIAENAFENCTSLTKITVPDSVNSIGKGAFYKCDGLKFIQLPFAGATKDGKIDANFGYVFGAYSGYSNSSSVPTTLTEIIITGGDKIDSKAFYGCDNIVTLTLPYVGTSLNSGEFFGSVFGATNTSNYVVPDSLTSITILSGSIAAHAFHGCDSLINVTIGNDVTSIGEGAFYNCSSIQSIKLPFVGQNASVTSGYNAVFGYIFGYGVKTISYGTTGMGAGSYWSMSDYDISINQYSSTQNGKQSLYYYKIPNSLKTVVITNTTQIPQNAFYKCSMLDTVIIPKNATLKSGAFDSCPATVIRSCKDGEHNIVTIPAVAPTCNSTGNTEGTKCSVCGIVFSGNLTLDTLDHEYENGICKGCGEKKASEGLVFTLNEATDTYTVSAIGTCTDANVIIPARYKGKDVTTIGESAFENCTTMESITIPASITKSHSYAFLRCTSLKAVYIEDIVAWVSISFTNMRYSNPLEQAGNLYLNGELVKDLIIPSGATKIGTLAFINCTSLTSIEIPNSVTYISQGAFDDCVNLKTVKLGTGITEIWDSFTDCTSLENLYIYDLEKYCNIEFVNGSSGKPLQYATKLYLNNTLLTTITVPTGVTDITNAFSGYKSLKKIVLPSTLKAISSSAFLGCTELAEVVINEGPTKIESNAFYNCSKLKSIVIPDSVLTIADSAFKNCTGLESIEIGDGVTEIPNSCFTNLDNLTSVVIGNGVTKIGTSAFSYCDNLQEVTFGDNVKTIDTFAFGQCYALKRVVFPKALETIGSQAFYYCKGLETIEFSSSLKKIGSEAFYCCDKVTSMIFNGTQAQWNSVSKGSNWNRNIPVDISIKQ